MKIIQTLAEAARSNDAALIYVLQISFTGF